MTDEACRDVEIIGWLYQFYISEKKDQVFAALKKNVKITPKNIPPRRNCSRRTGSLSGRKLARAPLAAQSPALEVAAQMD